MIEIKIPTDEAAMLLFERMQYELELRIIAGTFADNIHLNHLNYKDLLQIAETSAFDIIFLLPAEVFHEKNNLPEIISSSIKSLAKKLGVIEFSFYPVERAKKIVDKIASYLNFADSNRTFLSN